MENSGSQRKTETGSVRDNADGKGRCDLLPFDICGELIDSSVLKTINEYLCSGHEIALYRAIDIFCGAIGWSKEQALLEASKRYEDGAKHYGNNNWRLGQPLSWYVSSGTRHYLQWRDGDTNDNHAQAFVWNMLGLLWTEKHLPEMNDLDEYRG